MRAQKKKNTYIGQQTPHGLFFDQWKNVFTDIYIYIVVFFLCMPNTPHELWYYLFQSINTQNPNVMHYFFHTRSQSIQFCETHTIHFSRL